MSQHERSTCVVVRSGRDFPSRYPDTELLSWFNVHARFAFAMTDAEPSAMSRIRIVPLKSNATKVNGERPTNDFKEEHDGADYDGNEYYINLDTLRAHKRRTQGNDGEPSPLELPDAVQCYDEIDGLLDGRFDEYTKNFTTKNREALRAAYFGDTSERGTMQRIAAKFGVSYSYLRKVLCIARRELG